MHCKIALFASGSGSNAENIIKQFLSYQNFEFPLIISNKKDAFVHQRAESLGVKSIFVPKEDFSPGEKVLNILNEYEITHIVLAGFLLKVPQLLVNAYPNKIINIHPALLPKFGGKGMYGDKVHEAVVEAREKESGITIHYVNEHYDEGNIIFQAKCEILPNDLANDVANKVHALEYEHFPNVIKELWGEETV